jgi:predicted DNA-binding transcriptional regulator AlpA
MTQILDNLLASTAPAASNPAEDPAEEREGEPVAPQPRELPGGKHATRIARKRGLRLQEIQHERDPGRERPPATGPPLDAIDAHRIISEPEAARLFGVSTDTLRRMSARGDAPPRIRISLRRIGYRLADCLSWLKEREEV